MVQIINIRFFEIATILFSSTAFLLSRSFKKNYIQDVEVMTLELNNIMITLGDRFNDEFFSCDLNVKFELQLPYTVGYRPFFTIRKKITARRNLEYFWPYIIFHVVSFTSSLVLLIASLRVIKHIIYISRVITKPGSLDKKQGIIVLDFNHCRFIGKSTFQKKPQRSNFIQETLEHISSLNINFFFSCLHYILNLGLFFVAMYDMLTTGVISKPQLFLIAVNSFLDCADVSTIFSYDSKYNLLSILFDKYTRNILYFLMGSVIFFYIVTFIMFTFLQYDQKLSTLTDCFNYLFALMLADSVKDVFHEMKDHFGTLFIFGIVFVFHMTFLQIFMALMASSFQKTKAEFEKVEDYKVQQSKQVWKESKESIKQFKNKNNSENHLKEEFLERYVSILKLSKEKSLKTPEKIKEQENVVRKDDEVTKTLKHSDSDNESDLLPLPLELEKVTSNSLDLSIIKKNLDQEVNDELAHFIIRRFRKKSEGFIQVNETKPTYPISDSDIFQNNTPIDKAIKSLTFEIAILIKYNFDLLKKYFTEFSYIKNKEKFSFILVIASSELCDNLLFNLKRLNANIKRIKL